MDDGVFTSIFSIPSSCSSPSLSSLLDIAAAALLLLEGWKAGTIVSITVWGSGEAVNRSIFFMQKGSPTTVSSSAPATRLALTPPAVTREEGQRGHEHAGRRPHRH